MSDTAAPGPDRRARRLTAVIYLLDLLGVMTGVTALVGLALNHAKRSSVTDPVLISHFDWQIRTVWWMLAVSLAAALLIFVGETLPLPAMAAAGAALILLALFWFVYRLLRGYMWLSAGEPVGGHKDGG